MTKPLTRRRGVARPAARAAASAATRGEAASDLAGGAVRGRTRGRGSPSPSPSPTAAPTPGPRGASGTIWYMGVKTRLLDALDAEVAPLLDAAPAARREGRPPALLDLFAGTGVVGARFAGRARILAADAQRYATVLAEDELGPPGLLPGGLAGDLVAAARERARPLEAALGEPLARERAFLDATPAGDLLRRYRAFTTEAMSSAPEAEAAALGAASGGRAVITAYWRNVYFGVQQAIDLDALRAAIAALAPGAARTRALAALVFAASRSTSATAHFAQPRALGRDSEVLLLLARRRIDIPALFAARLDELDRRPRELRVAAPRVEALPYAEAFAAFADEPIDVVYADPPYTQDNYSRFYHLLEVLVGEGAPPRLARMSGGRRLTKGRYPEAADRFVSDFTRTTGVEGAFERVTALSAARGAALVWSYAAHGLLVKSVYGGDVSRFSDLLRRHYGSVRLVERPLRHSGAGDKNVAAVELIAVCTAPRAPSAPEAARAERAAPAAGAAARAGEAPCAT